MKISPSRILVFLTSVLIASTVMATEEPKFSIIEKSEPFELRAYAPQLIAEVKVEGDLDTASSQGFRLIAAFIFGQNQVSEKISMTVPVGIETAQSTKIAMTVPVGIEASKDSAKGVNQWVFSFVMPSEYTMATLPKPINPLVTIRELPAQKRAAITFSGFYNEAKVLEKTKALEEWVKSKQWQTIGSPQFARYNPPWSIPFMRRNEILITLRD
ncbi:SOUL heme-binding protein [Polynucleobacter duraquae]|uniref:SOUL heme-binding protein n=1 Tax=Polynucleobacter duraquae TaxID=1835254 RepID=A0A0E3V1R6_9BURK|nr:heme-binding protein [Polynucleobacter duraquae]AKD25703.1 SOUL heme-binding protein [Polynucleobacter duraquae]